MKKTIKTCRRLQIRLISYMTLCTKYVHDFSTKQSIGDHLMEKVEEYIGLTITRIHAAHHPSQGRMAGKL